MNSVDLHFDEFGSGPSVVILHGLFGSARNWHAVAHKLARNRRVIVVDRRNHGRSPHRAPHDYPALAQDIAQLRAKLDLKAVTLIGHSMGGKAAMLQALTRPERLARLVVVDIAPVTYADQYSPFIETMRALPLEKISRRQDAAMPAHVDALPVPAGACFSLPVDFIRGAILIG